MTIVDQNGGDPQSDAYPHTVRAHNGRVLLVPPSPTPAPYVHWYLSPVAARELAQDLLAAASVAEGQ